MSAGGVTIGQAARFAGVTVKTVRHYHRLGLLDEPARDTSGYRRYTSQDLLRLVTIRTLAHAGVPLAQIPDMLDLPPDAFRGAVHDVDEQLRHRIAELEDRRAQLRRLTQPGRGMLTAPARELLTRLERLGLAPDFVAAQREALVVAQAVAPVFSTDFVRTFNGRLDDPEHVDLLKQSWEAMSWPPDDPRLSALADRMAANILAHPQHLGSLAGLPTGGDADDRYEMVNQHRGQQLPTAVALTRLVEERLRETIPRPTGPD